MTPTHTATSKMEEPTKLEPGASDPRGESTAIADRLKHLPLPNEAGDDLGVRVHVNENGRWAEIAFDIPRTLKGQSRRALQDLLFQRVFYTDADRVADLVRGCAASDLSEATAFARGIAAIVDEIRNALRRHCPSA
ncbi:hypothetical protein [Microbacterium sp. RU33B]|uniref:hypothetical protein n=1 Tax=Microbacterium sp. RU33B TaxID=1907390 RepID=UPI000960D31C|nr:hypothetical protein [Microbacterium sp. RU33B]SIT72567.1 hypothetical protein SAMN05880545_1074 [Microbacterium sp. RU33B]